MASYFEEALSMISQNKVETKGRNMEDVLAGTTAVLDVSRSVEKHNPGIMSQLKKAYSSVLYPEPDPKLQKLDAAVKNAIAPKGFIDRVAESFDAEAAAIDKAIGGRSLLDRTIIPTAVGVVSGLNVGSKIYKSRMDKAQSISKAGYAAGMAGDSKQANKLLRKSALVVANSGNLAVMGAVSGGLIGGTIAYVTIPEVEAGVRKAVAGVQVVAGESYKTVKAEAQEILDSAKAFGDNVSIESAQKYYDKAIEDAGEAARTSVKAAAEFGDGLVESFGSVFNEYKDSISNMSSGAKQELISNFNSAAEIAEDSRERVDEIREKLVRNIQEDRQLSDSLLEDNFRAMGESNPSLAPSSNDPRIMRSLDLIDESRDLLDELKSMRNENAKELQKAIGGLLENREADGLMSAPNQHLSTAVQALILKNKEGRDVIEDARELAEENSKYMVASFNLGTGEGLLIEEEKSWGQQLDDFVQSFSDSSEETNSKAMDLWSSSIDNINASAQVVAETANELGMVWVEGYIREDGNRVEGFWRKMNN